MKVKVHISNAWCILMSGAVTGPSLMLMTLTVSDDSLARDTQTDRQTDSGSLAPTDGIVHELAQVYDQAVPCSV